MLDLNDPDYWTDPYPAIEEARRRGRTTVTQTGEPALLSVDDVEFSYRDPRFKNPGLSDQHRLGIFEGAFYEWRSRAMSSMDGPDHVRLRGQVSRLFLPSQTERLRGLIRSRTNELLGRVAERGEMDFLAEFASDLPLWTMCRFIGIDDEDCEEIGESLIGTEEGSFYKMTPERLAKVTASIERLNAFVDRLIAKRSLSLGDDIVSGLIRAHEGDQEALSYGDLVALIVNVIGGAVGSSRSALASSILLFAEHPDQADLLLSNPDKTRLAIEECLRYHPPFRTGRRVATEDVDIGDVRLHAGDSVYIARQAANRDPERWENPYAFNIDRPERRHMTFGFGAHQCLGQAVARTVLQEAVPIVLRCLNNLEIVGPIRRVPFTADEQLESLQLRFRYAA